MRAEREAQRDLLAEETVCRSSSGAIRYAGFVWGGLIAQCPVLPFEPTREGANAVVVIGGRIVRPL